MTLMTDQERAREATVRPGSLVLIDLGHGSRIVVAADSLTHPLVGAQAGQRVRLRTGGTPRLARVLAVQTSSPPGSGHGHWTLCGGAHRWSSWALTAPVTDLGQAAR